MGWPVAAELPSVPGPDSSITVALIAALGTVVVGLIGLCSQWLVSRARAQSSSPDPIGERVAVVDARSQDDRRTLAQLDRHVDGIGDEVDKLRWEMDDMKAWRDEHTRRHSP